MSLREQVARLFARPKPEARDDLDKAASSQDRKVAGDKDSEDERKAATAIDQKQAELLRTKLTPELTIYGTQPQRPPTGDEARAQAEKLITGKGRDPVRPVPVATADPARDLLPSERVDGIDRTGPLEAEIITEPYVADIITLQAGHEVEADAHSDPATWTPEQRAVAREARIVELQAERASAALTITHTTGGGRTM